MKYFNQKSVAFFLHILLGLTIQASSTTNTESVFTNIYERKWWWTGETHSGSGSTLFNTQLIRQEIPRIIKKFKVESILDIPCGDFNWMKEVILDIPYIGADIVKALILDNQRIYQNDKRIFMYLDIIKDDLPTVDLILCRDCLVHLSNAQIWQALKNIKRSGSKYLLTTSYSETRSNSDIQTGMWRRLNLMAPPFNLKSPILIFNEGFEESKSLMLWRIEDLNIN